MKVFPENEPPSPESVIATDSNWWIDDSYWPGPKRELTFADLFEYVDGAIQDIASAFQKFAEAIPKNVIESYSKPPPRRPQTREEILEWKKKVQHGPYPGGYDRRGRKF